MAFRIQFFCTGFPVKNNNVYISYIWVCVSVSVYINLYLLYMCVYYIYIYTHINMYTIYYFYFVPLWSTNFPITIQRINFYYTEYSSLYVYHNHLEGLLNYGLLDPTPRISNSVDLDEA